MCRCGLNSRDSQIAMILLDFLGIQLIHQTVFLSHAVLLLFEKMAAQT